VHAHDEGIQIHDHGEEPVMRAAAPWYPALDEFIAENVVTVRSGALALAVFSS